MNNSILREHQAYLMAEEKHCRVSTKAQAIGEMLELCLTAKHDHIRRRAGNWLLWKAGIKVEANIEDAQVANQR